MSYYVYFITNKKNKSLYAGITNDLERRLYEHEQGVVEGFSQKYKCFKLVYFEVFDDPENAIKREKQIKRWRREKKEALIEAKNPDWRDLKKDNYQFTRDPSARKLGRDDSKIKYEVIPSDLSDEALAKSEVEGSYSSTQEDTFFSEVMPEAESGDQRARTSRIWHPFTQHKIFPNALNIAKAEGVYLHAKDGRTLLDGISSWWINIHGHCHPKIVEAVRDAAGTLDQVIFAGFTHDAADKLADKILSHAPGFDYVFFSDSGSTSVEVALKMAAGYWHNKGRPRKTIIALENGYHGDTFGTMATGARSVYSAAYDPFLFDVVHLPFPDGNGQNTITAFEAILKERSQDIAAFICEPLVQGAGGMLMYDEATLKALYDLCRKHNVFFIADEVMTAWGRTGAKFAGEKAGFTPDILCSSKALTNGFMPLAVTLCKDEIYQAFYSDDRAKTFFHSSSFAGNPLACTAALAALEIWDEEPVMERIQNLERWHGELMPLFEGREDVKNLRQCGTIMALDIEVEAGGYLSNIGPKLYNFYLENGLLLRPLGNTVYILPPYTIQKNELERIYDTINRSLDYIRHGGEQRAA
ncbi:MAG: adenosylmethionine--8-amino-7-oxononanoate transaminase [Alphaproteobacteria bacterium]